MLDIQYAESKTNGMSFFFFTSLPPSLPLFKYMVFVILFVILLFTIDSGIILDYIKKNSLVYAADVVILSRSKERLSNLYQAHKLKITKLGLILI